MKVHVVDGTYELFRAWFGAPAQKAPDGTEVGATRSFARSLLTLLAEPGVTHVAVAFDHVVESFRNDLFAGYKTGAGIEPELLAQFPLVEDATRALGVVAWPMVEFETDDALATAAHRFAREKSVDQIVICSPDKDFAQCVVADRVIMWDRRRTKTYDESGVWDKWGVAPRSIPDWLALVGDAADGIPGIPRWGARSSAAVLQHYTHVEAIPDDPGDWEIPVRGSVALAGSLGEHREEVALYKELATLRLDVPLEENLEDLHWRGVSAPALEEFCDRIGDRRLPERVPDFQ